MTDTCHCGQPLHYPDPETRALVDKLIARAGDFVIVHVGPRAWRVPRHYIALHGIKAAEVPSLGFEEVVAPSTSSKATQ